MRYVADHIDHICQIAGDALHAGIGSDLDGGFGLQSIPPEIDTVADLQNLVSLLQTRGYSKPTSQTFLAVTGLRAYKGICLPHEYRSIYRTCNPLRYPTHPCRGLQLVFWDYLSSRLERNLPGLAGIAARLLGLCKLPSFFLDLH
ncbi:MAG: membrane dipeptidase [Anaerolineales bacterium]|nr:membrane dipeptidase [Anaerolineales bacterium]